MIYQIQSSKHWLIRKLKELSEDLNSIKMIQSDTLIEIKSNLHGKKTVEWLKLRTTSMIWNIRKQKQPCRTEQQEEQRIQKK